MKKNFNQTIYIYIYYLHEKYSESEINEIIKFDCDKINDPVSSVVVTLHNESQLKLLTNLVNKNTELYKSKIKIEHCNWNDLIDYCNGMNDEMFIKEYKKIVGDEWISVDSITTDIFKRYVLKDER